MKRGFVDVARREQARGDDDLRERIERLRRTGGELPHRQAAHAELGVELQHAARLSLERGVVPRLAARPKVLVGKVQCDAQRTGRVKRRANLPPPLLRQVGRFEARPVHHGRRLHALFGHRLELPAGFLRSDLAVPEPVRTQAREGGGLRNAGVERIDGRARRIGRKGRKCEHDRQ